MRISDGSSDLGSSDLRRSGAKVCAVELDDGEELACDAVVVGIGIVPAVELAADAGLIVGNGIVVDAQCRPSNPVIFAAGAVAAQPDFFGGRVRMETYQNAAEQGDRKSVRSGKSVSVRVDLGGRRIIKINKPPYTHIKAYDK